MALSVKLYKKFTNFLLDVEFVAENGITVLFGRSGSGKSITLKMIAGLLKPDNGLVSSDEEILYNFQAKINLKPQNRKLGFVFQNHSLFPHLTIIDNIAFGAKDYSRKEQIELAQKKIVNFRLEGQEQKFPHQISGGQQQRAALARAIIGTPRALLLDEPFSAIDGPNRINMRDCLKRVMQRLNLPIILVTHDLNEAFTMGDKILIYDSGKIVQQGTPREILQNPASDEVRLLTDPKNCQLPNFFYE